MSTNSTITSSVPSTTSSSTSLPDTSTTSSEQSTTSSEESTTTTPTPSSTEPPPTSQETSSDLPPTSSTSTVTVHSTSTSSPATPPSTTDPATLPASSTSTSTTGGILQPTDKPASDGLGQKGTIAVAVVVPIVAVALILVALLFFWRKRKARKDAEELRRKEVEEYGYNPNNDPTLPPVGLQDGSYEMREDGSSGYRGWGTTAVPSSGRKASTTQSGPSAGGNNIGMAYSDSSPSRGPVSDTRSDNPLMGDTEVLGAMGPAAAGNRGDIHRGASNASSSYSAANRSDGSGEGMQPGGAYYSNQYDTGNPYGDAQYGSPPTNGRAEMSGQPVIRDVEARRNTRIENPSHFPQQSAGIAQNF